MDNCVKCKIDTKIGMNIEKSYSMITEYEVIFKICRSNRRNIDVMMEWPNTREKSERYNEILNDMIFYHIQHFN